MPKHSESGSTDTLGWDRWRAAACIARMASTSSLLEECTEPSAEGGLGLLWLLLFSKPPSVAPFPVAVGVVGELPTRGSSNALLGVVSVDLQ